MQVPYQVARRRAPWLQVRQEHVAHLGAAVPRAHGRDDLGQLGAASLVDVARVDPGVVEFVAVANEAAGPRDLVETGVQVCGEGGAGGGGGEVLEGKFQFRFGLGPGVSQWGWCVSVV